MYGDYNSVVLGSVLSDVVMLVLSCWCCRVGVRHCTTDNTCFTQSVKVQSDEDNVQRWTVCGSVCLISDFCCCKTGSHSQVESIIAQVN